MNKAAYLRELRAKAVAAGLCQECRCRPQKPGRVTCQHCLDKGKQREEAYRAVGLCACGRDTEPGFRNCQICINRNSDQSRRYAADHKARGLCVMCTKPAESDMTMCTEHLAIRNRYAREFRQAFRDVGLCSCGNEPDGGFSSCSTCRERNRISYRKRQQAVRRPA